MSARYPDLAGRGAVVSGGAGTIGRAITRHLQANGMTVWSLDRTAEAEPGAHALAVDVTDRGAVEAAAAGIVAAAAVPLAALVCCHGLQVRSSAMDATEDGWARVMEVNLTGAWRLCQTLAPALARTPGAAIVNITSVNGVVAARTGAAYGCSKAALNHLTRVLALELAPAVRVNAVAPTVVRSGMTEDVFARPDYERDKLASIPLARIAEAEDIAEACGFLLSASAAMITGHVLVLDGGLSAS